MIIGRIIGWLFLLLALAALAVEMVDLVQTGTWTVRRLGSLWSDLDRDSLLIAQAVVQRYIWPPLWDPFIQTILQWPGWLVFGVPGIVFVYLFRRRRWFTDA